MTRRMKGQGHGAALHGAEHDENEFCKADPACQPVKEKKPMTNLTDAVNALDASPGKAWLPRRAVLDLVKNTVAVPDTGTYIVASGEVYEAYNWGRSSVSVNGYVNWTINVKEPKPTFFEAGKTYSTKSGVTFRVTAVEKDGNGRAVAIGVSKYSKGGYEEWTTRRHFEYWEEVK